jgi:hypothetical protein
MWEIYDALIDGMAWELRVDDSFMGEYWTMARSGNDVGLAASHKSLSNMTIQSSPRLSSPPQKIARTLHLSRRLS